MCFFVCFGSFFKSQNIDIFSHDSIRYRYLQNIDIWYIALDMPTTSQPPSDRTSQTLSTDQNTVRVRSDLNSEWAKLTRFGTNPELFKIIFHFVFARGIIIFKSKGFVQFLVNLTHFWPKLTSLSVCVFLWWPAGVSVRDPICRIL